MDTENWVKMSLLAWKRILKESIEAKDTERAKYATWMLDKVLKEESNGKTS